MTRTFFPILKEAGWAHRDLVVSMPLLGRSDTPLVCFAEDLPSGYSFLTRQDAPGLDAAAFLPQAVKNLQARPTDLAFLPDGVAMCGGQDLTAERLLDPNFLGVLHQRLGPQLYVGVPHRVAIYAVSASAPMKSIEAFRLLVRFETQNGPSKGHAPVSSLAFCVENTRLVGALPLETIQPLAAPPPVAAAPVAAAPRAPSIPGVRMPRDLVRVDAGAMRIELSIVVVGAGAKALGRTLLAQTGSADAWGSPHAGDLEHFVMTLGAIRDWTTQLFVYALAPGNVAIDLASSADALVLAPSSSPEPGLASVAQHARRGSVLAFVGDAAAITALEHSSGVHPEVRADASPTGAMAALKEITKHLLAALRK